MRRLLLAIPFALLPLAMAHAADDHDHEHASLGAHEHGAGSLDVALDGQTLELDLDGPSMNLVGFEHLATTDADKAKVAAAQAQLVNPLVLFNLHKAEECSVEAQDLQSPLFEAAPEEAAGVAKGEHHHSDIEAHYAFTCSKPEALKTLDLSTFFKTFPGTHKIKVQLIGASGQQGVEATPQAPTVKF